MKHRWLGPWRASFDSCTNATAALLRQVWGRRSVDDTDRVRTVVKKLRAKLGDDAATPTYNRHRARGRLPPGDPRRGVGGLVRCDGSHQASGHGLTPYGTRTRPRRVTP